MKGIVSEYRDMKGYGNPLQAREEITGASCLPEF
jgi:hypothetical protein